MEPQRKPTPEPNENIRPNLRVISGGGESTPERADLGVVDGGDDQNETASSLYDQESRPQLDVINGGGESTPERGDLKSADDIRDAEEQGSPLTATNFSSNVTPKDAIKKVSNLRKFAPTIGISGLIIGIVSGLSMLLSPSMLFIHIKETLMDRFNIQSTALDARSNKILAKKMASMTTSCSKMSYGCKMNSLNKTTLDRMKKEGIIAMKNGQEIEIKSNFDSQRPDHYQIKNLQTGELSKAYSPTEIDALINGKDLAIAGRFRNVFDVRWSAFWDETFSGFMARMNLKRSSMLKGTTQEEIDKSYQAEVDKGGKPTTIDASGTSDPNATDAQKAAGADASSAASDVNGAVKNVANESDVAIEAASKQMATDMTSKAGKSGGFMLIASLYCGGSEILKTLGSATRAAQIAQGVAIAYTFLQVADEIKSGNADQTALAAKMSVLGAMLTSVVKDNTGKTVKKSGMEADGMGYLLRGDTPKVTSTSTSDYTKYIPGVGGWSSKLSLAHDAISTKQTSGACTLFNSPGGQLAQLALDFNPVGIVAFLGTTIFSKQISDAVAPLLAGVVKSLAGTIIASGTVAEDLGNALGVMMPMMMSEGANAGALMAFPKTPTGQASALAYAKQNEAVMVANAKIDQATKSPFDATSSNTALGSIVSSILPYYSGFNSTTGLFSSVQSIVGSSLSNIISPKAHADTSSLVGDCPDQSLKVIAGPMCNIIYGAPLDALNNVDPDEVIAHLVSQGQIDETSGDAVSDKELKKWLDLCSTGSGTSAYEETCVLNNDDLQSGKAGKTPTDKVYYILYAIDHRVQRDMDGEDPVDGNSAAGYTASTSTTATSADGLQAPSGKVVSPIEPGRNDIQMSAKYGHYKSGGVHFGVDLAGRSRYNVVSACDGTVKAVLINHIYPNANANGVTGSTNYLWIDCGNNVYMGYAHFFQSDLKPYITQGAKIGAGTVLYPEGNQGNSSGYHLHFQVSTSGSMSYTAAATTDPAAYLAKFGVQLPKPSY